MPTVLRDAGLRFHFFSSDGHEPPHVHVDGSGRKAKDWLVDVRIAKNGGSKELELRRTVQVVADRRTPLLEHGMTTSHDYPEKDRPTEVWCDPYHLHMVLADGRRIAVPLWWYPRLLGASPAQRNTVELMLDGVHWPQIDEDISVAGLLAGRKAPGAVAAPLAAE